MPERLDSEPLEGSAQGMTLSSLVSGAQNLVFGLGEASCPPLLGGALRGSIAEWLSAHTLTHNHQCASAYGPLARAGSHVRPEKQGKWGIQGPGLSDRLSLQHT